MKTRHSASGASVVAAFLSLIAGCVSRPICILKATPLKPEEFAGVWIGFEQDELDFVRLDLRSDFTGYCARVSPADTTLHDYGVEAYRVPHWTLEDWKLIISLTPMTGTVPLRRLLTHLYVLIPVLDNDKHYWVGDDEVEKLLRHGEGWLAEHPERELITRRYLKHRRSLVDDALARFTDADDPDPDETESVHAEEEAIVEAKIRLNEQRLGTVLATLKQTGAKRVLDLGCGEGRHWRCASLHSALRA